MSLMIEFYRNVLYHVSEYVVLCLYTIYTFTQQTHTHTHTHTRKRQIPLQLPVGDKLGRWQKKQKGEVDIFWRKVIVESLSQVLKYSTQRHLYLIENFQLASFFLIINHSSQFIICLFFYQHIWRKMSFRLITHNCWHCCMVTYIMKHCVSSHN